MLKKTEISKPQLEYIMKGNKVFQDDRGKIINYELPEHINWIGWIESKSGTVRANHYHPIQQQKCLLLSGSYIAVSKDLQDENAMLVTQTATAGDVIVTQPNVAHATIFMEDSVLLNLVNGEREHENFGKHTIPYTLIDDSLRQIYLENYKKTCRISNDSNLKTIISLGLTPLANNLLDSPEEETEMYPLQLNFCPNSKNVQLSCVVQKRKIFDNYLYVSSTSSVNTKYFLSVATKITHKFSLSDKTCIVDIGSNDGAMINCFLQNNSNFIMYGVEPAKNLTDECQKVYQKNDNVHIINGYFEDSETISKITHKPNIITAFNVFAHTDNIKDITQNVFSLLDKNGIFIIQVQYLLNTIHDCSFDNIYHEHMNYWSVLSLTYFFNKMKLELFDIEFDNVHGGSIRVYVGNIGEHLVQESVSVFLNKELEFKMNEFETYQIFCQKIQTYRNSIKQKIERIKKEKKRIVGYGCPAKATTILNYYQINNTHIEYIIEDNPLKQNKYVPGVKIPIKKIDKEALLNNPPDYMIVFAWNYFDDICQKHRDVQENGTTFITLQQLL